MTLNVMTYALALSKEFFEDTFIQI